MQLIKFEISKNTDKYTKEQKTSQIFPKFKERINKRIQIFV